MPAGRSSLRKGEESVSVCEINVGNLERCSVNTWGLVCLEKCDKVYEVLRKDKFVNFTNCDSSH